MLLMLGAGVAAFCATVIAANYGVEFRIPRL
jgi:hypothetical protein